MTDTLRTTVVRPTALRARFAARLSALYGAEVPAYTTLVEACRQVNHQVLRSRGRDAERFGRIERVTTERHGAIRVGSPRELAEVARIFAALGMSPCGFYDLRDAGPSPVPVVATAFRPVERHELAANPFRVFTSVLVPEDRRFFDADLEGRVKRFLAARRLFPAELLTLADRAVAEGHLGTSDAGRFLDLATASFALSTEPVDRAWYCELERVSSVAADIAGVTSTHINHLTPRVLDIDALYATMAGRGVTMIDRIQGPPRWDGVDVLLRQTSFRALAEPRAFRDERGHVERGTLRVRFGEVEARGIALTPTGRDLYDGMTRIVDERMAGRASRDRQDVAAGVWAEMLPRTEEGLRRSGLAHFTYRVADGVPAPLPGRTSVDDLVARGVLVAEPVVYEDFLPRSAAGIFASNLTHHGGFEERDGAAERDQRWMSEVIGTPVAVPDELYARESERSLAAAGLATGAPLPPA